ncbi:MAG: ABC transporter permease [Bacteroidales bacterium]|jgi:ABC-2 type transport system permease protein
MKFIYFAGRNSKEILRDPFSMILAGVLPVIFIVLFSIISGNVPMEVFQPVNIVPGLTIFGFTFITMFLGLLIAKDKSSSFLTRLFVSPLKPWDFIMGYFVPVLPMAVIIAVSCLVTGLFVGVPLSVKLLFTFLSFIPFVLFSGFLGIFLGTICRETQVLAVGNIFIIACPLLGGAWMDVNILGETLKKITDLLPFSHAIEASRIVLSGRPDNLWIHLGVVCLYAFVFFVLAVFFFSRKMRSDYR